MFELSTAISPNIKILIDDAFSLYFIDNSACANKIRIAIEGILDDLKAPKKKKDKNGRLCNIPNLHQRIENFSKKQPKICRLLMALKIIGNDGSHIGDVDTESILDAFEILKWLIEVTYTKNEEKIRQMADKIINR